MPTAKKEEPKDQRQIDREAELAKQAEIDAAMQAFYAETEAAAAKALADQAYFETHGVRKIEGKP